MKIRTAVRLQRQTGTAVPAKCETKCSTKHCRCEKHQKQAEVKQGVVLSNLRPRLTEKAAQAAECKGVEVKRTQVARLVKSQVLYVLQPMSIACEKQVN
jgi:hypothetical protein